MEHLPHHAGVFLDAGGQFVPVDDPQTAAEINACDLHTFAAQVLDECAHTTEGVAVRLQLGDLAADVDGHTDRSHPRQRPGLAKEVRCGGVGDTELVLGLAGGDLG